MHPTKNQTTIDKPTAKSAKQDKTYVKQVKRLTAYLENHGFNTGSVVIAAFAIEPIQAFTSGLRMARGEKETFH